MVLAIFNFLFPISSSALGKGKTFLCHGGVACDGNVRIIISKILFINVFKYCSFMSVKIVRHPH